MSSVRRTKNGLWEIDVRSKLLPKRRLSMLLDVILRTGVRLREACMLRIEHVDLAGKTLEVQNIKERNGRKVFRSVTIPRELAPAPTSWVEERRACLGKTTGLLFPFWDEDPSFAPFMAG